MRILEYSSSLFVFLKEKVNLIAAFVLLLRTQANITGGQNLLVILNICYSLIQLTLEILTKLNKYFQSISVYYIFSSLTSITYKVKYNLIYTLSLKINFKLKVFLNIKKVL